MIQLTSVLPSPTEENSIDTELIALAKNIHDFRGKLDLRHVGRGRLDLAASWCLLATARWTQGFVQGCLAH